MRPGDPCRTVIGDPARYLGGGQCAAVAATLDRIYRFEAAPPVGDEYLYPLPKMRTLKKLLKEMPRCLSQRSASGN